MNKINKLATLTCILSLSLPAKADRPTQEFANSSPAKAKFQYDFAQNTSLFASTMGPYLTDNVNVELSPSWNSTYSYYKNESIFETFPFWGSLISSWRHMRPLTDAQAAEEVMSSDDLENVLQALGIEADQIEHALSQSKSIQDAVISALKKFLIGDLIEEDVASLRKHDLSTLADNLLDSAEKKEDVITLLANPNNKQFLHFEKVNTIFDYLNYVEFLTLLIDMHKNQKKYDQFIGTTFKKTYYLEDEKLGGAIPAFKYLADFLTGYRDAFVGGLQFFDWTHNHFTNNAPQLTQIFAGAIYKYTDAFSATMKIATAIRDPQTYSKTVKTFHTIPTEASGILSQIGARLSHLSITRFFTRTTMGWFSKQLPQLKTVHEAAFPAFLMIPIAESTLRYGMTYITANEDVAYWTSKGIITGLAFGSGYAYPMAISLAVDGVTGLASRVIDKWYDSPTAVVKHAEL